VLTALARKLVQAGPEKQSTLGTLNHLVDQLRIDTDRPGTDRLLSDGYNQPDERTLVSRTSAGCDGKQCDRLVVNLQMWIARATSRRSKWRQSWLPSHEALLLRRTSVNP
jgi:hypothetical protein